MIKKATKGDCRILAEMAVQMWDSHMAQELEAEFSETLNDKNAAFFIGYAGDLPVGFASDCELDNAGSLQFHIAMGFTEANRIICFTKRI